jgi:hypothetical protein
MHEYSVVGHSREKVVFYISLIAVVASPTITWLASKIVAVIGFNLGTATVGAAAVFAVLFWVFNSVLWRTRIVQKALGVPDLNGEWSCQGHSIDHESKKKREWTGVVKLTQTWNKMQVTLRTNESKSYSTSAIGGIKKIADNTYILSYLYDNAPSADQTKLHAHSGLCSLVFDLKASSAEGSYFNSQDRPTFGTMRLRRKV